MSDSAELKAELTKLSRMLSADEDSLAFLAPLGWPQIRELRQLVSDHFFAASEPRLRNLAAVVKLVPVQVLVKLAPLVFEPRLGAGLASLIDEEKALKLVPRLPPEMLASTVPYIDPRRVGPLMAKIPVDVAKKIVPLLLETNEHAAIGQLIDYVTAEQLDGLLPYIDDVSLLKIAEVAENKAQFNVMIPLVADARIGRMITTAKDTEQIPIVFELIENVDPDVRARMTNIAVQQSDSVLQGFLVEMAKKDRFELLLSALPLMGRGEVIRLARNSIVTDPSTMSAFFVAARRTGDWGAALRLLPYLPEAARSELVNSGLWRDADTVGAAAEASFAELDSHPELFVSFLQLAERVPEADRALFADPLATTSDTIFWRAIDAAAAAGAVAGFLPLVGFLPAERQATFASIAANLDTTQMRTVLVDASDRGVLPELFEVAAEMPREAREQFVTIIADNPDDDLLGSSAKPESQQETWNSLLKLTDDLPTQLVSKLGEQATMFALDEVLPLIVKAGQATGRLATSFTLLDEINKIAEREGIPVEFSLSAGMLRSVAESVGNLTGIESLTSDDSTGPAASDTLVSVSLGLFKSASAATSKAATAAGEKTLAELAGDAAGKVSQVASIFKGLGKSLREVAEKERQTDN